MLDFQVPFVFRQVALVMTFVEHAPDFRPGAHGVRQALKDEVTIVRAISVMAQGSKRQGVGCVVGEVKTADG